MNKYEAMLIIKPDLSEEEKKTLFNQISEVITKHNGAVQNAGVWAEKRKLSFTIKRYQEGTYYLINFSLPAEAIDKIKYAYKLNEQILRALITRV